MKNFFILIFLFNVLYISCKKDKGININYDGKYYGYIHLYTKRISNGVVNTYQELDSILITNYILNYRYKDYNLSGDGKINYNSIYSNSSDSSTWVVENFIATIINNQVNFSLNKKFYSKWQGFYEENIYSGILNK